MLIEKKWSPRRIAQMIQSKMSVASIVQFGSSVETNHYHDLDLLVITRKKKIPDLSSLEKEIIADGVPIHITYMDYLSFTQNLEQKIPFVLEILNKHSILYDDGTFASFCKSFSKMMQNNVIEYNADARIWVVK